MSSKPIFPRRSTSKTLGPTESGPNTKGEESAFLSRNAYDALVLSAIFIMLVWPWIFFGAVWQLKGVQMNDHLARLVTDHPHSVSFFVTLFGGVVSLIVSILFSIAIVRFAQEWVTDNSNVTLFHISLLSAFRYQRFPWSPWDSKDRKYLLTGSRLLLALLVFGCVAAFAFITPGATSLVSPVPFDRTTPLSGTEIDFSSNTPECAEWFNANRLNNTCDWGTFKGVRYTSCLGENQMVDVLESGRGNILSTYSDNSESLVFSQLGNDDGLHFLGSVRGVLPIGPNGVPAFDTVSASPISNSRSRAAILSYNYTLDLQGLRSEISCSYDTTTPIRYGAVTGETTPWVLQYNGTCPEGADLLVGVGPYISHNSNNTLGFWACKNTPENRQEESYVLYINGHHDYASSIGNITCMVSPIQFATLPVTYMSQANVFSSDNWTGISTNTSSDLIQRAIIEVGTIINQAQTRQANLVAESVITFGVKAFNLPPHNRSETYLRLYEAMIQGIIEYEATYIRLLHSTDKNPPPSCVRAINGSASYQVIGWAVRTENIGFLIPMTIINLAAFIITLIAVFLRNEKSCDFDPMDSTPLVLASSDGHDAKVHGWETKVKYRFTKVVSEAVDRIAGDTKGNAAQGAISLD